MFRQASVQFLSTGQTIGASNQHNWKRTVEFVVLIFRSYQFSLQILSFSSSSLWSFWVLFRNSLSFWGLSNDGDKDAQLYNEVVFMDSSIVFGCVAQEVEDDRLLSQVSEEEWHSSSFACQKWKLQKCRSSQKFSGSTTTHTMTLSFGPGPGLYAFTSALWILVLTHNCKKVSGIKKWQKIGSTTYIINMHTTRFI